MTTDTTANSPQDMKMIGKVYNVPPMPPDASATRWLPAGVVTLGVEYREVDPAALAETYRENADHMAEIDEKSPDGGFFDAGVSIHVCGTDDGHEYLRFDVFDGEPHYHYVHRSGDVNNVIDFDVTAHGEMLPWTLDRLRNRMPEMLRRAGGEHLVGGLDAGLLGPVLDEVGALAEGAQEAQRRRGAVTLAERLGPFTYPLPDDPGRFHVAEPAVKDALAPYGIAVPRPDGDRLVLKAYGPGLVHKSEAGAVRLGLAADEVHAARLEMQARLDPAGFLVEEQLAPGPELIVGVRNTTFGLVVLLGVGGVLVEALDQAAVRLLPIDAAEATALVDEVVRRPGAVDRDGLIGLILGLARFAVDLGPALAEIELNPVIGAVAADARLVLQAPGPGARDGAPGPVPAPRGTDFAPLLAPRTVAVAGASATRQTFGNRFLAAYRDAGWTDGLYAIHPEAPEVDGVPAIRSPSEVPGGVDYLVVAVPAAGCAPLVRASAGHARFAHVISGGFRETGADAAEADLLAAARTSGIRVLGPNCMGVFAPAGRQTFQLGAPRTPGPVSVICQSGGLAGDIIKGGDGRGIRFAAVVTIGNAVDVTPAELLAHFLDDPATAVVGLYLEDPRDGRALVAALRTSTKPVVALLGGLSRQGAVAVASHTGALASDRRIWDAVARDTGLTVVDTLEGFLAALTYLQRWWPERPEAAETADGAGGVLVVGPGGGASVLATDACDRAGLEVTRVADPVAETLRGMGYGAGTSVANPIEIPVGPVAPADGYHRVLTPVLSGQPFADVLVHVNVQSYFSYGTGGAARLLETIALFGEEPVPGRFVVALRNLDCAPAADAEAITRACVTQRIPATRTLDDAAVAIAAAQAWSRRRGNSG